MKEWMKSAFLANWTPWEKGLLIADVLLAGVLIGWITSPFKSRYRFFGSNSWNTGEMNKEEKEQEEE